MYTGTVIEAIPAPAEGTVSHEGALDSGRDLCDSDLDINNDDITRM